MAFLGFDDRFQIHEWLGSRLGIEDALIILALAIVELLLLLTLGKLTERPKGTRYYIYLAALFLGLMILIDGWVPRELVPRLSLEDLSKTWATVFIFLFAWSILRRKDSHTEACRNIMTSVSVRAGVLSARAAWAFPEQHEEIARGSYKASRSSFIIAMPRDPITFSNVPSVLSSATENPTFL